MATGGAHRLGGYPRPQHLHLCVPEQVGTPQSLLESTGFSTAAGDSASASASASCAYQLLAKTGPSSLRQHLRATYQGGCGFGRAAVACPAPSKLVQNSSVLPRGTSVSPRAQSQPQTGAVFVKCPPQRLCRPREASAVQRLPCICSACHRWPPAQLMMRPRTEASASFEGVTPKKVLLPFQSTALGLCISQSSPVGKPLQRQLGCAGAGTGGGPADSEPSAAGAHPQDFPPCPHWQAWAHGIVLSQLTPIHGSGAGTERAQGNRC